MQLTVYSDYALRLLIYLALHRDRLATIQEVSTAYGISRNHLVKIAQRLGRAGLIRSMRGRQGGIELARKPDEIGIGEVIRLTENSLAFVECFADQPEDRNCPIAGICRLQDMIAEAGAAFFAVLDSYTLADAVDDGGVLARFFSRPRQT